MIRYSTFIMLLLVVFTGACQKEEAPAPGAENLPLNHPAPGSPAETPSISSNAPVMLPEEIKKKWKAVKLRIEDKQENTTKEHIIDLGSELSIPGSNLVLRAVEFIPDLKIEGSTFTSASNELLNPSVHIVIIEEGKEIFDGWLFQLFPTVHPFRHDRFSILLNGPVSAF